MKYFLYLLIFILIRENSYCQKKNPNVIELSFQMEGAGPADTFRLEFFKYAQTVGDQWMQETFMRLISPDEKGRFKCIIPTKEHGYINLSINQSAQLTGNKKVSRESFENILSYYFAEPADDIKLKLKVDSVFLIPKKWNNTLYSPIYNFSRYRFEFTGRGAAKYQCRYETDRLIAADGKSTSTRMKDGKFSDKTHYDRAIDISLSAVEKCKSKMSSIAYEILRIDFFSSQEIERIRVMKMENLSKGDSLLPSSYDSFLKQRMQTIHFSNEAKLKSAKYVIFLANAYRASSFQDEVLKEKMPFQRIKRDFEGEMRERLLTAFAVMYFGFTPEGEENLTDALMTVSKKEYLQLLKEFAGRKAKGAVAYNFSLPDTSGKMVKLNQFKGKVIFIDFWYTGCGACRDFYDGQLSIVEEKFKRDTSVVFITINVDRDKQKWLNSINSGKYTSRHVVNLNTSGMGSDHPVIKHYAVRGYPKPLIIDGYGRIFDASESRDAQEIAKSIKEAKVLSGLVRMN